MLALPRERHLPRGTALSSNRKRLTRAGRQRAGVEHRGVDCCSCATRTSRSAVRHQRRRCLRPSAPVAAVPLTAVDVAPRLGGAIRG